MKIGYIVSGILGAGVGAGVAWYLAKKKYRQIADAEIEDVKSRFTIPKEPVDNFMTPPEEPTEPESEKVPVNYESNSEDPEPKPKKKKTTKKKKEPDTFYVIRPEDFDMEENYATSTWTYWQDGVVTNEDDNPVPDWEDFIGADIGLHFGEYEEDAVYIRNDAQMCDYEVLLEYRKYSDAFRA